MTQDKKTLMMCSPSMVEDPWQSLKKFTSARIALGRVGSSLPTKEVLNFGLAHAMARDAVHTALDVDSLKEQIEALGFSTISLSSRVSDRSSYLLRPDLGRRLKDEAVQKVLLEYKYPVDLIIVVGDGLSSTAVQKHVGPMLKEIKNVLPSHWTLGPVSIVTQARVAIADEIGELMKARMTILLIGERPGLSSPDSLGVYLTFQPKIGSTDADRNCISNIRHEGLSYENAAKKVIWLACEAMRLKISGVQLKDESDIQQVGGGKTPSLFRK